VADESDKIADESDKLPARTSKGSGLRAATRYGKSEPAIAARNQAVWRLANRIRRDAPWLTESDYFLLRRFCRLEMLARIIDNHFTVDGILDKEGDAKRLVSEYRAITATQQKLAESLGLTPETRLKLIKERRGGGIDIVAEYALEDDQKKNDEQETTEE